MRIMQFFLVSFFSALFIQNISAQGCSDAGFCTLSDMKPHQAKEAAGKNLIRAGVNYGSADHDIKAFGAYVEYGRMINERISVSSRVSSLGHNGFVANTYGLSDVYLNAAYKVNTAFSLTAGVKIPLSDGNTTLNGQPLPMDYQSSLGTTDIIAGINIHIASLQLTAGIQQPLTQNKNSFLAETGPSDPALAAYQSTNQFRRKGDIMLRASYPIHFGSKVTLTPGILPVYHLGNDEYTDLSGRTIEIEGSGGITLNGNLFLDYRLNSKNVFQLIFGMPFIVRDARPDGLTRSFVAGIEYSTSF